MITFKDFYNKYNGVKGVGDTPENKSQCVGLIEVWLDEIGGLPHIWGNATDLYANAPDESFIKIPNTPTAVPLEGDIIVWDGKFNGGVGHTGIATGKGDANSFDCFEQNDPIASAPRVKNYNYAYVDGWLRPKSAIIAQPIVQEEMIPYSQTVKNAYKGLIGDWPSVDELAARIAEHLSLDKLLESLTGDARFKDRYITPAVAAAIKDVQDKEKDLEQQIADLEAKTTPKTVPSTPVVVSPVRPFPVTNSSFLQTVLSWFK